jgi:hypothetical protein
MKCLCSQINACREVHISPKLIPVSGKVMLMVSLILDTILYFFAISNQFIAISRSFADKPPTNKPHQSKSH